jgi:hypothetical protein
VCEAERAKRGPIVESPFSGDFEARRGGKRGKQHTADRRDNGIPLESVPVSQANQSFPINRVRGDRPQHIIAILAILPLSVAMQKL